MRLPARPFSWLQSTRWRALLLVWLFQLSPAWSQPLPGLGEGEGLSLGSERRLGDRIAQQIYRDNDYLEDPVLDEYVASLWRPLVQAAVRRGQLSAEVQERFAWRILLVRDRSLNAFALPGGYLGVHLGLIAGVASSDELASVLAHELTHVTQRHIARGMDDQARMAPWLMGSMILGALLLGRSAQGGQALILGGQAAATQSQLNYSRDMEREADRIGFGLMTDAGFDARGFASMFGKLQQAAQLNDSGNYPYLRSHPMTTERMADMQLRLPPGTQGGAPQGTLEQALLASRARVMAQANADAMRSFIREAEAVDASTPPRVQAARFYAAALAQAYFDDLPAARAWLTRLSHLVAPSAGAARQLRLLQSELALRAQAPEQAWRALVPNDASPWPEGRPEGLAMAEALARLPAGGPLWDEQAARMVEALRDRLRMAPDDAAVWQALSPLLARQGKAVAALRADGEAQMARLDLEGAIDRFRSAQDRARRSALGPGEHIEAAIVDARLRQAQALMREWQKEK